jgi:hypothetical protein
MKTPPSLLRRRILSRATLIITGGLLGLAVAFAPALRASADDAKSKVADKAQALPLTATFAKDKKAEGAPYTLTLKNVSAHTVKVKAKILLAVAMHADSKAKHLPEQTIDAGKDWSIPGLAAQDKVELTAEGFAPLEVVVP